MKTIKTQIGLRLGPKDREAIDTIIRLHPGITKRSQAICEAVRRMAQDLEEDSDLGFLDLEE